MPGSKIPVVVDALMVEGQGNLAVRLVAQGGQRLPAFEAGAHVDLHLRDDLIRQYSIASSPRDQDYYLLCVKRQQTSRGGSTYVHDRLQVGEELHISPPRNLFALEPADHYSLLAGGIGITPLLSMAEVLDEAGTPFDLHYYIASRRNMAFAKRIATGFQHGQVHPHFSEEFDDCRKGLPADVQTVSATSRLYLCGPEGFMQHVADLAMMSGWNGDRIHRETFVPLSGAAPARDIEFQVRLASSGRLFDIAVGRSIAEVLIEAGVDVPLSCEMGICGMCLTKVVDGIADHRDSIQTDAEKTAPEQKITLCCSRSRSAMITIDL